MNFALAAWFITASFCAVTLAEKPSDNNVESSQDNPDTAPVVTLNQGKLQGLTLVSRKGNKYHAFLGVKYGKAPVRFGPPETVDSWDGIKLATKYAPPCFQFCLVQQEIVGAEDCLTLNVYTPQLKKDAKLKIMFYIHGGGFQVFSNNFHDGKYFVDENVILVTVQYRMGALGFLNTGDDTVLGNIGLRDQSAALRWVQDNIENFGGDKDAVTIFGYSAGGASVHYHMLSPMSKGLFNRAISLSGTALNPWAFQQKPKELAKRLAENVGCTTENAKEMVECFRSKTPAEIVTGQMKLAKFPPEFDVISMLFCPSVEEGNYEPKFLSDTPYKLTVSGKTVSKVPWIAGVTADEGALYTANILESEKSLETINSDWHKMASNIFYYENSATPAEQSIISKKVWEFYFGDEKIGRDNYLEAGQVFGDRFFVVGLSRTIKEYAKRRDFPVYPYIFNYTSSHSVVQGLLHAKEAYGVAHCDDLKYLFNGTFGSPDYDLTTKEGKFSQKFIKLLVSFAEDRKPTSTWGSAAAWEPFKNDAQDTIDIPWYVIGEDTKVLTEDPFKKRTDFWENLPLRELGKEDYPDGKDEL